MNIIEDSKAEVRFQKGASDSGAYAVAFATDLAYGNNPASHEYE